MIDKISPISEEDRAVGQIVATKKYFHVDSGLYRGWNVFTHDEIVPFRGMELLVSQACNDDGPHVVIPGEIVSYKTAKSEPGLPISEVSPIINRESKAEIKVLVREKGFSGPAFFW